MPDPVVVTRPLAQAAGLVDGAIALGHAAQCFPLLEIQALEDPAPLAAGLADLERYALVAFVSPNAVDAALAARPDWPTGSDRPALAVVGEGSRAALARHGITDANARIHRPVPGQNADSEALLANLDLPALRGQRALIIRGASGREFFADALRQAGAQVDVLAAYRRASPSLDEARCAQLQELLQVNGIWIITSSEALRNLQDMVQRLAGTAGLVKIHTKRLIVPHPRIAQTAQRLGFQRITLTGSGDHAMLDALQFLS